MGKGEASLDKFRAVALEIPGLVLETAELFKF